MALPKLPWYNKLKSVIAPTERASEIAIIVAIFISLIVLFKGNPIAKAALAVYWWSP